MKWLSSPSNPAKCQRCNGLSYVAASRASDILLLATLWLIVSGLTAALVSAAWPLICGILSGIAYYSWHWYRTELIATDPETTAKTQVRHTILNVLALLFSSLWS